MGAVANNADTVEYRVALLESSSPAVMAVTKPQGYCLPRVTIPKWRRPAEEINDVLRQDWQLNTLVLTILNANDERPACAVTEVLPSTDTQSLRGLTLQGIESLDESELDTVERASIQAVIAGDSLAAGPFARRGWLSEAQEWIRHSIPGPAIKFSGELRQYNASDTFALLRLGTIDGDSYWLKATGEPNKHECALTVELSRLFPQYLPPLIAVREDWNAWVTKDAGLSLSDCQDVNILAAAVENLADFQMQSLNFGSRLASAGCMDRRIARIQSHLREIFAFLEEAMERQISTKVKPLTPVRLSEIREVVDRACAQMQDLGIPDCLVNGDINLDNILYDGERFCFLDWAEGGIGHPFLTLQQVIQHAIREGEHLNWVTPLCEAYKRKWRALLQDRQIDAAFVLMPLVTVADYLYGRGDRLTSPQRHDPWFQGFARTLGRYMDRAATELSSAEALQL